jgi:tRNA threonylcarbamoyladenosine biosynthesis protein TsaB
MLILAIDTTSEPGGVGVFLDRECLSQVVNQDPANRYAVSLFPMVDRALEEAKFRHGVAARGLADIGLIAVATGPGSFTGIRVGLAAAQGWAKAFGLPVCGVSVLEALVEAGQVQTEWAASILDARRGDFYLGLFRRQPATDGTYSAFPQPAGEGWLLKAGELGAFFSTHLPEGVAATCVVRGHDQAVVALRQSVASSGQWQAVTGTLVEAVAHIALRNWQKGRPQTKSVLDALYIRRPDAELYWKG